MANEYQEFTHTLKNGETVQVRFCNDWGWSSRELNYRAVHFEFRGCTLVSETGYKSEFRNVDYDYQFDPHEVAGQIIETLVSGKDCSPCIEGNIEESEPEQLSLF